MYWLVGFWTRDLPEGRVSPQSLRYRLPPPFVLKVTNQAGDDHLCGLVVKAPGYRSGGPGFDSRALQEKISSGSGTGSTQPREYNWGATLKK
jgi:hypothetical protein